MQRRRQELLVTAFALAIVLYAVQHYGRQTGGRSQRVSRFTFSYETCDALVNEGAWVPGSTVRCGEKTNVAYATCGEQRNVNWIWSRQAQHCGAHRVDARAGKVLLAGRWVVVLGDSVARAFFAALVRHVCNSAGHHIWGHNTYDFVLPEGIRLTYMWAPYCSNLIAELEDWTNQTRAPDVVVAGAALWHMLHVHDLEDYMRHLQALKAAVSQFLRERAGAHSRIFWISTTEVQHGLLKTREKKRFMTQDAVDMYNRMSSQSGLLAPGGPMQLLDMHAITQGCGRTCTTDGIHYTNNTYDAAVQIWLNVINLN